jgi:hypothetical protein
MSPTQIVALVVTSLVIAALVVTAVMLMRRHALRRRFGPEYDRAVADADSRSAAEAELRQRERRHAELHLTGLSPAATARYAQEWTEVQARFVEEPTAAVAAADELMTRLVRDRGYPNGDYREAVAYLSVEHGHTLGHYRDAHEIHLSNQRGEATTEQLRRALVHYRAIFADILGEQPVPEAGPAAGSPTTSAAPGSTPSPEVTERVDATPDGKPVTPTVATPRRR